ncbi:hypothetical protein BDP27DRAFT_1454913 [Rhodocollybia butyracea]|uniref:Uncharacterized protein n=1 Tax=Rhodocollybia butyracea TaxID=206335 RepID=A0A9P5P872_9AGAR|nr:hypothetical protein BDP27DRAFT_1454913 [Rhodocollybia butyracea]
MRFTTFAFTALLGCFLSIGICVAKPISVRGGSTSEEITARAVPAGQRTTHASRPQPKPQPQLTWISGEKKLAPADADIARQAVISVVQGFDSERMAGSHVQTTFLNNSPAPVAGAPAVTDSRIGFIFISNGEVFSGDIVWPVIDMSNLKAVIRNSEKRVEYRTPASSKGQD